MKMVMVLTLVIATAFTANAQKKGEKTVIYYTSIDCANCKAKVEKNLPFEKGVKDLKVDLAAKTVTVTFMEKKNTTEGIQKAIEKLGYSVSKVTAPGSQTAPCCKEKKCETGGCGEHCGKEVK